MRFMKLAILTASLVLLLLGDVSEVWAQYGYRPATRSRSRLRRNQSPVLSPYLNLVPGAVDTFTGQYLLRTVPHQQFAKATEELNQSVQGLQDQIDQQQTQLQSSITATGHRTSFLSYGKYYSFSGAGQR